MIYRYAKFRHKHKSLGILIEASITIAIVLLLGLTAFVDDATSLKLLCVLPFSLLLIGIFAKASKYRQLMHD
ncbi:hypothetical protein BCT46_14220 [Vibrio sp. 10N.261.46.E8]|nr:hypothetical protein BH584_04150 [Vibrio sp. 10N.261.45.E1]PMJ22150.1 hypothetical protein BCU27_17190 [Vibrio sp. 10N.286.45.B6]PML97406.1 hypothetical protein BCT66_21010 [Vibrio sp. 10N.261.49.E11]PMM76538.1 hypothetical protein BCT48_01865 [Vibrio sp. 10N.261.46.F12]PMM82503.1 hypothetical protein BCT46_14220 [Vibrio sp. 10N.261.46.E8]PMN77367.1 hypothetical protein BCT22_21620 [Vibrio sp. 10N.261.45.A1]PMN88658.1 hypothetical protein BCT25_25125 [Vibrio sp. 10N.261.45.A6]